MDRRDADELLRGAELVPFLEGNVPQAKGLERQLLERGIPVLIAAPPPKACCGGGCGCGAKLQLLIREGDIAQVTQVMQEEWLEAVRREGVATVPALVPLKVEDVGGELSCPACGFAGALVSGACADCGLQLDTP